MSRVLVTGGSGFIGSYCLLQLLAAGHEVRASVRSLSREAEVRAMLERGAGAAADGCLSFVAADLESDAGWPTAVAGCDYVLHVASPFPAGVPRDENELIVPAREGALRVLRAARDAGVRRVVLTSSFAAMAPRAVPRRSPRPTGPTRTVRKPTPTSSPRQWPSARPGISSPLRAAPWSSRLSIRWRFSARCSARTIRPPSSWSSGSWMERSPDARGSGSAWSMFAMSPTCTSGP
jgi:nucleoside-diphosphate-sugar epimerase